MIFDPAKVVVDWTRPLFDGGLGPGSGSTALRRTLELGGYAHGFHLDLHLRNIRRKFRTSCSTDIRPQVRKRNANEIQPKLHETEKGFRLQGILTFLEKNFEESNSDSYREWMTQYMSATRCSVCLGKRLRPESLAVKLAGWSISDFTALSLSEARPAVDKILERADPAP